MLWGRFRMKAVLPAFKRLAAVALLIWAAAEFGGGVVSACEFNSKNDFVCAQKNTPPAHNPFTPPPAPPTNPVLFIPGGVFNPPPGMTPPPGTVPPDTTTPPPTDAQCNGGGGYDQFIEHLKLREGVVKCVYRDSLGYPTVGVGHLVKPGDNLQVGDCISDAQVDAFLQQDAQNAWNAAQQQASAAGCTDGCFVVALGSVNYQLGTGWQTKFPSTTSMINSGNYAQAADSLNGSLWQRQTPVRVADFQAALRQAQTTCGLGGGGITP